MDGYIVALIVFLAYVSILLIGKKLKFWEKIHATIYWGPILMFRTVKGRNFIDRMARRARFWTIYGKISIWVTVGSMIMMMLLLLWEAFLVLDLPSGILAPSPESYLLLPVINPIIPLWYGVLGLATTLIVHEFAHGILTRVGKMKIESLGILLLIFPIGAFVEPNEAEVKAASRPVRGRMFAAGPATNVFVAFICFMVIVLLLAPSARPIHDGAVVTGAVSGSPAEHFDIPVWSEIISVDGDAINNASGIDGITFDQPGDPVNVTILYEGNEAVRQLPGGVVVNSVVGSLPAFNAKIEPGMIIASLDDKPINNISSFRSIVESSPPFVEINITVLKYEYDSVKGKYWFIPDQNITNIKLTTKWLYYFTYYPDLNKEEYKNISYIGVTSSIFGVRTTNPETILDIYANPFKSGDLVHDSLVLIALPFLGYTPVEGPMAALYEPTGMLAFLPSSIFWILVNCLYWIFWINLLVGTFNALPAIPFDGGYVFKDLVKDFYLRLRKKQDGLDVVVSDKRYSEERLDKTIGTVSIALTMLVLILILWTVIGPRL